MKKRTILSMLAVVMLTAMSFAATPGKPAPKPLTIDRPLVKPFINLAPTGHMGLKAYLADDAVVLMPVPQVVVMQNQPGAPGSTGSYMCCGTFVYVWQYNECGGVDVLQEYWVASSIHCIPVE